MARLADHRSRWPLALALAASVLATACGHPGAGPRLRITDVPADAPAPRPPGLLAADAPWRLPGPDTAGLTREERELLEEGLLPPAYAMLARTRAAAGLDAARALGRRGHQPPYAADFGDPDAMLAAARYARATPGYGDMLRRLRRGDMLFVASNDPKGFVQVLSGGPFDHVLLRTDAAPPGTFVEAVGITGTPGETTGDRVRWASAARYATPTVTFRLVRPPAEERAQVDAAIAFARRQLGKPYNYTFSDDVAGDRGFYCSSLVYRAYRLAGVEWTPAKDAARDRVAQALMRPVLALGPEDPLDVAVRLMRLMHEDPKPGHREFARFLVREVLPGCRKTKKLVFTIAQRERFEDALVRVLEGRIDPRDLAGLVTEGQMDTLATLGALRLVAKEAWPYADVLAALLTGADSATTRRVARALDTFGGRAAWTTLPDMESPTDLAWSGWPHEDFNVKADTPVAAPWPFALVARPAGY